MRIAHINELDEGINERVVGGHRFFIYKAGKQIRVYDSICPHQGASLRCDGERIYCRVHHWCFDAANGRSSNIQNASLFDHQVQLDSLGNIHIQTANKEVSPPPPATIHLAVILGTEALPQGPSILPKPCPLPATTQDQAACTCLFGADLWGLQPAL